MKRSNVLIIISGLASLIANVLAILSYFTKEGPLANWRPDRGLLIVLTFVLLAYGLATWSALGWRWTHGRGENLRRGAKRAATFLLNGLVAFPLLTLWLYLVFSEALFTGVSPTERWFLAMGFAWGATPFTALGLMTVGDVLGPLLAQQKQ